VVIALALAWPATAAGMVELVQPLAPVKGNPADRLVGVPIEEAAYDPARRCTPRKRRPGMAAFAAWLADNARGANWGTYRCEKWGRNSASLHAEGRALDWHLDASRAADRREAARLIGLLLAPDAEGNPQALARRMGVEEIIWDCGYWSSYMTAFKRYTPCVTRSGRWRRRVNATVAHRDHIHFGLTVAGSMARTSFWQR
jgi:hypothetical protein